MDRNKTLTKNKTKKYKCIMANTSAIRSMMHIPPTNYHLLAAKEEPYQKAHLLMKNIEEFSWKMSGEWASRHKKRKK